jgi:hypothetical protein
MLIDVWRRFDDFPMETLSKAWRREPRQWRRDELRAQRAQVGSSGNCFDLAVWLWEDLRDAGIPCHAVLTDDDHVAIVAEDYLCDLGDMWLQPLPLQHDLREVPGLFPAATISTRRDGHNLHVTYHRPGGKFSEQAYSLRPVAWEELLEVGGRCQGQLYHPLVEMRIWEEPPWHWEFSDGRCMIDGIPAPWDRPAQHIAERTGMQQTFVEQCLAAYK